MHEGGVIVAWGAAESNSSLLVTWDQALFFCLFFFCLLLCLFGSRGRGHDLRLASWVLSKLPKCAALVSRVFAAQRSRARALPLLNLKKKRDCSQSNYFRPQFWLAFLPTQTQPLLYSKRRIQKNSPLTFWQLERFTVHLTLIMRKCLYEHWSWYRVFSHDVTAAILVSQNNETAAMLVSQTNPLGIEIFSYANAFFCFSKFA